MKSSVDTLINDILQSSSQFHSALDLVAFYTDLEELLSKFGKCNSFSILMYYDRLRYLYVGYSNLLNPQTFNTIPISLEDVSIFQECFNTAQPIYTDSIADAPCLTIDSTEVPIIGCEPLIYRDQVYGMLIIHSIVSDKPDTLWLHILSTFASTAIINMQLYDQTNREASENATKLWAINNAGELLSHMNLETLLVKVMELVLSVVSAQVGSIMLDEHGVLVTKVEWGLKDEMIKSVYHASGISLVDYVKQNQEPFLVLNPHDDERIDVSKLNVQLDSLIVFPLFTNDRLLGIVNIVNSSDNEKFSSKDMDLLVTVTNLVSISIENALLYKEALEQERVKEQLNIARQIQQDLMPKEAPLVDGYEIDGINITCDETGGDYFDYFSANPAKFLHIAVGDVSGHGIGSALVMAAARAHIRASINNIPDMTQAISVINNVLSMDFEKNNQFMTLFIVRIDLIKNTFHYISAGHEIGLIYQPENETFLEFHSTGVPLGLMQDEVFEEKMCQLHKGEIILLYTDGIKEAMNAKQELYGLDRLRKILRDNIKLSSTDLKKKIIEDVENYCGGVPRQDDWTVVIVKVNDIKTCHSLDLTIEHIIEKQEPANTKLKQIVYSDQIPQASGEKIFEREIVNDLKIKEVMLDDIVECVSKESNLNISDLFELRLCLDEVLTNCVLHGNKLSPDKKVYVCVTNHDSVMDFLISDEGEGFPETKLQNLDQPTAWFNENGRGLFLIAQLMDNVIYFNNGKSVLMKKDMNKYRKKESKMLYFSSDFQIEDIGGVYIVSFVNDKILNETNIEVIHQEIIKLVEGKPGIKMIMDFKNIKYLSSSVLSKLVSIHKKINSLSGDLSLSSIDPVVKKIFQITQLEKLFIIFPDVKSALDSFQK